MADETPRAMDRGEVGALEYCPMPRRVELWAFEMGRLDRSSDRTGGEFWGSFLRLFQNLLREGGISNLITSGEESGLNWVSDETSTSSWDGMICLASRFLALMSSGSSALIPMTVEANLLFGRPGTWSPLPDNGFPGLFTVSLEGCVVLADGWFDPGGA